MKRHNLLMVTLVFLVFLAAGATGGPVWAVPSLPDGPAAGPLSFDAQTRLLGPIDLSIIEELKREHGPDGPQDLFLNEMEDGGTGRPEVDPDIILEYYSRVSDMVTAGWAAPAPPPAADLICTVEISVAADGRAVKSKIRQSSGSPDFDQSVLAAIEKSSPFPPLPPEFKGQTVEVWIQFYAEELLLMERARQDIRPGGTGHE